LACGFAQEHGRRLEPRSNTQSHWSQPHRTLIPSRRQNKMGPLEVWLLASAANGGWSLGFLKPPRLSVSRPSVPRRLLVHPIQNLPHRTSASRSHRKFSQTGMVSVSIEVVCGSSASHGLYRHRPSRSTRLQPRRGFSLPDRVERYGAFKSVLSAGRQTGVAVMCSLRGTWRPVW
jgi:hypothetical protein